MSLRNYLQSNSIVQTTLSEYVFIVCTSLSFSYDVFGIATITYTLMYKRDSDSDPYLYLPSLSYGGRTFRGYLSNIDVNELPETNGWYESNITLVTLTLD